VVRYDDVAHVSLAYDTPRRSSALDLDTQFEELFGRLGGSTSSGTSVSDSVVEEDSLRDSDVASRHQEIHTIRLRGSPARTTILIGQDISTKGLSFFQESPSVVVNGQNLKELDNLPVCAEGDVSTLQSHPRNSTASDIVPLPPAGRTIKSKDDRRSNPASYDLDVKLGNSRETRFFPSGRSFEPLRTAWPPTLTPKAADQITEPVPPKHNLRPIGGKIKETINKLESKSAHQCSSRKADNPATPIRSMLPEGDVR